MIKFFRKIRQRLLTENKFSKYLIYAIGEIVLVVIGILIALQINNWNEKRQQKQILKSIYKIVVEDLKNDITEINDILKAKKVRESIFNKVLDGEMTKKDYQNCIECEYLIVGSLDLSIEKRGYNLLSNFGASNISADSLTIQIVQFYTKQLNELNVDNPLRINDIENNVNHWKDNYVWYSDYISGRNKDGFIEYALNNSDYTNRVANYHLLNYTIYIPILEEFNSNAQIILKQLEEKIKQ
tara:strand:- start:1111 stop:1833 length:723 start_codon:yes stop_codon:yes gene_type:complete